jgi:hypothetical protein
VAGGPFDFLLGMSDPHLTLFYAAATAAGAPVLNWQPGEPSTPTTLSDTSDLGLALAVAGVPTPGTATAEQYMAWTGTDDAHTINVAMANPGDPTAVNAPGDYEKITSSTADAIL